MHVYLYLNEEWHADTWVDGGDIPINPASVYKSMEREGVFTPDENLIHKGEMDMMSLVPVFGLNPAGSYKNWNIDIQVTNFGAHIDGPIKITNGQYYQDNGLLLSFSTKLSLATMRKFKTKKTCVLIPSVEKFKKVIDKRLGSKSIAGRCEYTDGHERNHFLKSNLDGWQAEYRLFWKLPPEQRIVNLPAGLAARIKSTDIPEK